MQLTIKHEHKAPLFHRKEITVEVSHPGTMTPKTIDVKKALADHYKTEEDVILIHTIQDSYGTTTCTIHASVYDTADAYKKFAVIAKKPKKKEEATAAPAKGKK